MEDKKVFKIGLIISLLGVLLLLILTQILTLPLTGLKEIANKEIDEKVRVQATLESIYDTEKVMILNLKDESGKAIAVFFKEEPLELKKGDTVLIEGRIVEYQKKKEIEVSLLEKA